MRKNHSNTGSTLVSSDLGRSEGQQKGSGWASTVTELVKGLSETTVSKGQNESCVEDNKFIETSGESFLDGGRHFRRRKHLLVNVSV